MADKRVKRSTSLARYTVYTDSAIEKTTKAEFYNVWSRIWELSNLVRE